MRAGITDVERVGLSRVGRAKVPPGVQVAVDLNVAGRARVVVVVDHDPRHTIATLLDRVRQDGMSATPVGLKDAHRVCLGCARARPERLNERIRNAAWRQRKDLARARWRGELRREPVGDLTLERLVASQRELWSGRGAVCRRQRLAQEHEQAERRHALAVPIGQAAVDLGQPLFGGRRQRARSADQVGTHLVAKHTAQFVGSQIGHPDLVAVVRETEAVAVRAEAQVRYVGAGGRRVGRRLLSERAR